MQSFIFFAKTLLFFFISLNAVAQVTLPVPKPAAVFGSYLAGYGCRYTFTGSCNFAITPSSPLVAQEKNETGRLIDSINSQYGAAHVGGQFNDLNYLPKLGAYAYAYGIPPANKQSRPFKIYRPNWNDDGCEYLVCRTVSLQRIEPESTVPARRARY